MKRNQTQLDDLSAVNKGKKKPPRSQPHINIKKGKKQYQESRKNKQNLKEEKINKNIRG